MQVIFMVKLSSEYDKIVKERSVTMPFIDQVKSFIPTNDQEKK